MRSLICYLRPIRARAGYRLDLLLPSILGKAERHLLPHVALSIFLSFCSLLLCRRCTINAISLHFYRVSVQVIVQPAYRSPEFSAPVLDSRLQPEPHRKIYPVQ